MEAYELKVLSFDFWILLIPPLFMVSVVAGCNSVSKYGYGFKNPYFLVAWLLWGSSVAPYLMTEVGLRVDTMFLYVVVTSPVILLLIRTFGSRIATWINGFE
jgi:hypothetical protein